MHLFLLAFILACSNLTASEILNLIESCVTKKADHFPETISYFEKQATKSGGTRSTFVLYEKSIPKLILKQIASNSERFEHFKEEILADAIYQAIAEAEPSFGIHVPDFRIINDNGKLNRISEFLKGNELGFQKKADVAKGFVVDAFMANWDLVVDGKNLWLSNGIIYRMDNGGSLRHRSLGELKATLGYDFSQATSDLYTLRGAQYPGNTDLIANSDGKEFYDHLTSTEILEQIAKLVALEDIILKTADTYNDTLKIADFKTLRHNLVTRLNSLKSYYYDQAQPVSNYVLSHPFAVTIPNKSSASILIVADHMGDKKILLGKRVRHEWWGNFGGKADDTDSTLLNAAIREVSEESMGVYHVLPDDLVNKPSHDLVKGGSNPDALHRMYLLCANYNEPAKFVAKLSSQTSAHSREYTDFTWVSANSLLGLVHHNLETTNEPCNEKQYTLNVDGKAVHIHHPLMDMLRQAPVIEWLENLSQNQQVATKHTSGSTGATFHSKKKPIVPTFFDPRAEELARIHHLMTKHLDLISEMKHKKLQLLPASPPLPEQTATDAHLRWSLEQKGQPYVPGNDPQNIYLFLRHVSTVSTSYYEHCEPSQKSDYQTALLKAMAEERKMKDWFVFYHALQGKMAFIYDIATEFRNFLRMNIDTTKDTSSSMHSLRALDTFFKGLANVEAFVKDQMQKQNTSFFLKINNYDGNFQEAGLSTNTYLFGNPRIDSSSTFDLFYGNRSISPPDYHKFLNHLLAQFGLQNTEKYFHLFNRHFGLVDENQLLQIFINPESVNDIVYLSSWGGHGIYDTFERQSTHLNPKDFLTALRTNPENAARLLPERTDSQAFDLHHLQARIFLKPEIITDSRKVQIKRYFKTRPKDTYLKEIRAMVIEDLTHWLKTKNTLPPDTLENPSDNPPYALPPLQKIYRHLQQATSGTYVTKTTEANYAQFLKSDDVQGVKQIFTQNPKFDLFKPIPSIDYKIRGTLLETYPVSLIASSPKIIGMFTNEYLQPMLQWTKSIAKSPDPVKAMACLLSLNILVKQGIDCYADAQAEATLGMKNSNIEVRKAALSLFESLLEKNTGLDAALESAINTSKYPSSYHLFKLLVKRNKFLAEAIDAAQFGVSLPDEESRNAAIDLFEALFEKNIGFDEALQKATSKRYGATTINLFKALAKKDQHIDKALAEAQQAMLSGSWEVQSAATALFNVLFDKNKGFSRAFYVVNTGIASSDSTIRNGVIFLSFDLFKKWKDYTKAANFAAKLLGGSYVDVQLCAIGIFTDLVAADQSLDKAILAAAKGVKSDSTPTQIAAIALLKVLAEKKYEMATIGAIVEKGIRNKIKDEATRNAYQDLALTFKKQTI